MELSHFLKILKKNYLLILLTSVLFCFIFYLAYILVPSTYIAEGTLFAYPVNGVQQESEVSNELNYSRNIIAISNSPEFKLNIKDKNLSEITFTPLVGIVGGIKLKEISPNILSLSIYGSSVEDAYKKYNEYVSLIKEYSNLLNKGNSRFEVSTIKENPIITSTQKNIYLFLVLGFTCGVFISMAYLYVKKYDRSLH